MEALTGFKEYMIEEELSENTISSYMRSVRNFFEKFDDLNKQNLVLWKEQLSKNFSPKTVNLRLSGMECYCKYKGVNFRIKRIKVQKRSSVENVITAEQYQKLIVGLEADKNYKWAFYIKVLARTGARISEALQLTKGDLLKGHADLYTKCKYRCVYIEKSLIDEAPQCILEMENNDKLFKSQYGKPLTSRGVSERLKKFAKKYGIPEENCYPHAFRHFFAMQFLERTNNNIFLLADVLGHSNVNTTMIYTRMSQKQQKEAVNNAVDW